VKALFAAHFGALALGAVLLAPALAAATVDWAIRRRR